MALRMLVTSIISTLKAAWAWWSCCFWNEGTKEGGKQNVGRERFGSLTVAIDGSEIRREHQLRLEVYPIIYRVYTLDGAPSQ